MHGVNNNSRGRAILGRVLAQRRRRGRGFAVLAAMTTVVGLVTVMGAGSARAAIQVPAAGFGTGQGFCAQAVPGGAPLSAASGTANSFDNVYACGPANNSGTGPYVPASGTNMGFFEDAPWAYQCVELANRFLFDQYYTTNGYLPIYGQTLVGGNYVDAAHAAYKSTGLGYSPGTALPVAGDIISMWNSADSTGKHTKNGSDSHVAVVTGVTPTASGWNISVLQENVTSGATATITVSANGTQWSVFGGEYTSFEWLTLAKPAPPVITTTSLPGATVGVAYSTRLSTADHRPGTWTESIVPPATRALPSGLSESGGLITGTPTTVSSYPFKLTFTDTNGLTATATASIAVSPAPTPPVITTTSLPGATVGKAYSTQLTTADHRQGNWQVGILPPATKALPPGLALSGYTISGTPTTAGTYPFKLTFTDTRGLTATAAATLVVSAAGVTPTVTVTPGTVYPWNPACNFTPSFATSFNWTATHFSPNEALSSHLYNLAWLGDNPKTNSAGTFTTSTPYPIGEFRSGYYAFDVTGASGDTASAPLGVGYTFCYWPTTGSTVTFSPWAGSGWPGTSVTLTLKGATTVSRTVTTDDSGSFVGSSLSVNCPASGSVSYSVVDNDGNQQTGSTTCKAVTQSGTTRLLKSTETADVGIARLSGP